MRFHPRAATIVGALCALPMLAGFAAASSHMDAPLITLDDAANTTDVYAFVSRDGNANTVLTTALSVYPFEDPGIGPNAYDFDPNVLYGINISLGQDLPLGRPTLSYFFQFRRRLKNRKTILQSYLGVVNDVDDASQNRTNDYTVLKFDHRNQTLRTLGRGVTPPNNQGIATPEYNLPTTFVAKPAVSTAAALDKYTRQAVTSLSGGYTVFAGQREDGFYGDIQAVFDLLNLRGQGMALDSQKGFNLHTIALQIPLAELGGSQHQVGVYGATYRQSVRIITPGNDVNVGPWVQVGRQGNPLFCEALVAMEDKDEYNRTEPTRDAALFKKYAETPELAKLLNALVLPMPIPSIETNRTDLAGIFIPDLIKVDLSTGPVPLAGSGLNHPTNPDDTGFSKDSLFGGDTVFSSLANGNVPSGWPNGRRFGDDVIDIAVSAVLSDLRVNPPVIRTAGDNVDANDVGYHKVFPYATTPHSGRAHKHD